MDMGTHVKDAKGNTPVKLTGFEERWRADIESGELQKRYDVLRDRKALPLKDKIALTSERIREWYEAFDGRVSVGFSGGKDSSVLLWLVRRLYPDVQGVFCNTGLEYPEIYHIVKKTPNIRVMRPKKPFHHIVRDFGWPVASKKVARGVSILRNPTGNNQNIYRLYDQGINRFGEKVNGFMVPKRWRFLVDAPFPVSDKCCEIMKKEPMRRYEKETGNAQFIGMMASDSKAREKVYLQTGCNAFDAKHPRSMPMGFWTEQDVIQALLMYGIPYAKVYGDIIQDRATGQLSFTGVHSTGCIFCCFGLHMEGNPNRFQKLFISHPRLWKYCMNRLGLGGVLDYMRDHCPDRSVRRAFRSEPDPEAPIQIGLFAQ